jgi:precorrin-2 dehydrogenase/sirohydrochlorin ferrochelatase
MRQPHEALDVLPVNLIVGDHLFLVVGGGRVALRKTKLLLDAGGRVRVVSPESSDELHELAAEDRIELIEREFRAEDVEGVFLAFAATGDRGVNIDVLEQCRREGALCCPVDKSWPDGDFLTPATFRKSGLVVSVSTGGRSCRRARLVKENLSHHIDLVSTSDLLVMGTSHQHLTVGEREPYHLTGERFERAGQMLTQVWGVHEFLLLNTCNRVELIAAVAADQGMDPLIERIMGFEDLEADQYYEQRGFDAFRHLALVSGGLLSQSPGEDHIVAQVKDTLDICEKHGWADGVMRGWIGYALHLSKDIREATGAMLEAGEIEDVCMHYMQAEGMLPADTHAAVIGTGVIGRGVVQRLVEMGYSGTWCYHRNVPDLPSSWEHSIELASMDELDSVLAPAGVVFTAVDSSEPVLDASLAGALGRQGGALVFDLGIPRNAAPGLDGAAEGVRVLDLDDLKEFHHRELVDVAAAIEKAEQVIEEHREMYDRIIESLQGRNQG